MDCPGCGHANRESAKFCAQCAAALPTACGSCGTALSAQARFCDQCGTPVASAAPAGVATRKVVTVLFADLVGSTSFGEQVDAESAREAMADYHAMATAVIEANGGTVAKFIGDGVMALFGVPETAEDDADRAVAAGMALQHGFAPIRGAVAQRHGAELGLRVGINTGEIVLAEGDADIVGDAINTAARLEAACTPGHVLVGEETWRLTRSRIRYEVLGEVSVKGKDEPVATFQVADDEVHVDAGDDLSTPFVGRADELARLGAAFERSVADRSARLATVIGAPGVGKSRIAREFGDRLGDGATVVELRCERAGTATFAPIADLLRSMAAVEAETSGDDARAGLRDLVADLDDADRVADLLASFVGAAPARSTEEAFLAVRRLVEAVARRRPFVVVVDDIQWAEPLFLDLLEHLAEWVTDAPALLLGLARPELRDIRPSLAEEGRVVAVTVALEGLDAGETAALAAQLVGADSLPAELIERLPDSTEGNPLFVRELMRMLVDDGVISETADGWHLTIEADAVEVPPTIQSLLSARLDRMPADERRLIELASVVGPDFALGAVAEIAEAETADLRAALDRLRRRELVEPTGLYWGDEPIYRFHHVLIRDAAYRRLLKRNRSDLHLRVGEWTERTAADLPGEHEVAIAYHFEQAHEYRRQLADVDETVAAVGRRAAELLSVAAQRALERDDLPAASVLAERALARLDDGDPMVATMLIVAAEALLGLGDVGGGRPVVERLSKVADADAQLTPWAEAFVAQLTMLTEPDRLHDAERRAGEAAVALAAQNDDAGVAKARLVRAGVLARLGQVGQCEAELDEALTAARAADDRRRVAAVLGSAPLAALWGPSPIPRAGGRCLDVIRLLRITTGSPAVEATSVRCQAVLEALRGRFDTARSMLADARATVEELGLRHALGETDLFAGIVELLAGDAASAEPHLRAAHDGLGRLGIGSDVGRAAAYLARAVLQLGSIEEAAELAAESAELAGENPQTAIAARTAQAEILAAQGRYDEAVSAATDAVARAEGTDVIVDHADASAVLARVAALAGDTATAESAARVAGELYERKAASVAVHQPSETPSAATAVAPAGEAVEPEPDPEPGAGDPANDKPWNEADRLTRRFIESYTAGERDDWLRMLAPDQVTRDRRPLVGIDTDGADGVAEAYPRDQETRGLSSTVETVAVRGDRLALVRWRAISGSGREWDDFHLVRWTADDLNELNVIFPPDRLGDAIDELDRLYLETVSPSSPEAGNVRLSGAVYRSLREGHLDEAMALLDERYVQRDHRSIGWPTVDWAGMRERLSTMVGADAVPWCARIHRTDGLAGLWQAAVRVTGEHGAEQTDHHLLVTVDNPATGLVESIDQFPLEQLDEATRVFRERAAAARTSGPRWNEASVVAAFIASAARIGRPELAADLVAGDAGPPLAGGRRHVIAAPNAPVALVALLDEEAVPAGYVVERLDAAGRMESVESFAADDLRAAADAFDARFLESVGEPDGIPQLLANYVTAWRDRDIERMRTMLTDDFEGIDRRPIAVPPLDREGHLAAVEAMAASGEVAVLVSGPFAANEQGSVTGIALVGRDDAGRLTESLQSISMLIVSDGLLSFGEIYPVDAVGAAVARFHELTRPADQPEHEPWNEADRLSRIGLRAFFDAADDDDRHRHLHPDHVSDDRRPLVGYRTEGKADITRLWGGTTTDGTDVRVETIAVRGDHLVVSRLSLDSPRAEFDFLHLERWTDDGLHDLLIRFDLDQLAEAIDELNRLYVDELGDSVLASSFDELVSGVHLLPTGDIEGFLDLHAPHFVMRDHRSIGWGDLAMDEYAERLRSIVDVLAEVILYQERFHAIETATTSTCLSQNLVFRFPDGSEQSSRSVMVMMMDPITGLMVSMDQFAEDDIDSAVRCYDDLIAERGPVLHNEATTRAGLVNAWRRRGDDELIAAFVSDDAVFVDEHGEPVEPGPVERREVMAVRGDRLALVQVSGPGHAFVVEEIDQGGRLVAVRRWPADRLFDAVTHLERRHLEIDAPGPADGRNTEFVLAILGDDRAWLEAHLGEGYRFVDHRALGNGEIDRDTAIEYFTISDGGVMVRREVVASGAKAMVAPFAVWNVADDGHVTVSIEAISVATGTATELEGHELFATDDLDRALARFDEIEDGAPSPNEADRLMRQFISRFIDGPAGHWTDLVAAEATFEDRSPVVGHEPVGKDELIKLWPRDFEPGEMRSTLIATIATRGESLAVTRWVAAASNGEAAEWDTTWVTRWNADGRADLIVRFSSGQYAEAMAELDRLDRLERLDSDEPGHSDVGHRDGRHDPLVTADNSAVRAMRVVAAALNDHTYVARRRELTAPGYTHTDHRPIIGHPPMNVDEMIPLMATAGQASLTFDPLELRGDRLVLWQGVTTYESGGESAYLGVAEVDDQGLVEATVFYDGADLDAARADLDRRWIAQLSPRRQQVSRLGVALGEAWVAPSTHSFDQLLAPEFELVDGRTLGMGTLDRAAFEQALRGREADGTTGPPVPSRVGFVSDDVMVFRANNLGHAPGSGIDWEEIACNVLVAEGGRIARLEMFDDNAWADAIARATQVAESREVDGGSTEQPASEVAALASQLTARVEADDFDGVLDLLEHDFVKSDHRRMVGMPEMDRHEYVADLRRLRQLGWSSSAAVEPPLVRGNALLALVSSSYSGASETQFLALFVRGSTGRLARFAIYDEDDRHSALADLDVEGSRSRGDAHQAPVVANVATDALDEAVHRMNAGEAVDDLIADAFRRDDRRHHLGFPEHGAGELRQLLDTNTQLGARHSMTHVAVRGNNFALGSLSTTFDVGDSVVDMLVLSEFDGDGRLLVETNFEMERLVEALDELDERWLATLDPADAETYRVAVATFDAYNQVDLERLSSLMASDYTATDHRPLGFGLLSRSDILRLSENGRSEKGTAVMRQPAILRIGGGVVVWTFESNSIADDGGTTANSGIHVSRVVGGQTTDVEIFGDDQFDRAMARADELAEPATRQARDDRLSNLAFRWMERTVAAGGLVDADVFTTDFVREDRRSGVAADATDRIGLIESMRVQHDMGATYTWRPVAVRGELLALGRLDLSYGDNEIGFLTVLQVDDEGRLRRLVHLDPGDLSGGLTTLDELWLESLGPADADAYRFIADWLGAYHSADARRFADGTAESFRLIDHRPLGFGELSRDETVELLHTRVATRGSTVPMTVDVHRLTPDVLVGSHREFSTSPDGGEFENPAVFLVLIEANRVAWSELFDHSEVDAALARADELTGSTTERPRPSASGASVEVAPVGVEPVEVELNTAGTMMYAMGARWNEREHVTDLLADDFVRVDRRAVVSMPDAGPADMDEVAEGMWAAGAQWPDELLPAIAQRGDRLSLQSGTVALDGGAAAIRYLTVLQTDGHGRAQRLVLFDDPEQLDEALAELDGLWLATLDPADAETRRATMEFGRAYEALDVDRLDALLTPDFRWVDHVPARFPPMDRDEFLAATEQRRDVMGEGIVVTSQVHFLRDGVSVTSSEVRGVESGARADWVETIVVLMTVRDGQISRNETFTPDQLDDAIARAEELTAPAGWLGTPPVLQLARRAADAAVAGELEVRRDYFEADFVRVDERRIIGLPDMDRDEFMSEQRRHVDIGWRGFRLVGAQMVRDNGWAGLVTADFADERESPHGVLYLEGASGRIGRIVLYDEADLDNAFDALDEAWLATLDPADAETYRFSRHVYGAYVALDRAVIETAMSRDLVFVDHRPLSFGQVDYDGFMDLFESRRATRGPGLTRVPAVHFVGNGVLAYSTEEHTTDADGSATMSSGLFVSQIAGGQSIRHEIFADDQLDAALAVAESLAAVTPDVAPSLSHPLEAHADRFAANFFTDQFDAIRDQTFEPDFVREDRRSVVQFPSANLDEFRDAALAVRPEAGHPEVRRGPLLAVRDNAYLGSATTVYPGGVENDSLIVLVAGPSGRIGRMVVFDPDDRDAALLEMNRAWAASLPEDHQAVLRLSGKLAHAARSIDFEAFAEIFADDVVIFDHRKLGGGLLDLEGFQRYFGQRQNEGGVTGESPEAYVLGPEVIVFQSIEWTGADDGPMWQETFYHVMVGRDGTVLRWEWFEGDQRDEALALAQSYV